MSLSHHESNEQSELLKMFQEQREGLAARQWPDGRISGKDDGQLAFRIGSDHEKQLVQIDFPKAVTFLAMPPREAIQLAQMLIKHARSIATEPLSIILHQQR